MLCQFHFVISHWAWAIWKEVIDLGDCNAFGSNALMAVAQAFFQTTCILLILFVLTVHYLVTHAGFRHTLSLSTVKLSLWVTCWVVAI
jgi:hypothetical protein